MSPSGVAPGGYGKRRGLPSQHRRQQESGVPADGAQTTDSAEPAAERRSDKLGGLLDSLETVLIKGLNKPKEAPKEVCGPDCVANNSGSGLRQLSRQRSVPHGSSRTTTARTASTPSSRATKTPSPAHDVSVPMSSIVEGRASPTCSSAAPFTPVLLADLTFKRLHAKFNRSDEALAIIPKKEQRDTSEEEQLLAKFNTIEEVIDDSEAIDLQLGQGVYRDDPRFMREVRLYTDMVTRIRNQVLGRLQMQSTRDFFSIKKAETVAAFERHNASFTDLAVRQSQAKEAAPRLEAMAHRRAREGAGLSIERIKLMYTQKEVMDAVADVLAEQFNVLTRIPVTHSVFSGQMKQYRKKGFAVGVAPSSLAAAAAQDATESSSSPKRRTDAASPPKPRERQLRPNPNGIMAPLNWELAVVNYEAENPTEEPWSMPPPAGRESPSPQPGFSPQKRGLQVPKSKSRGSVGASSTRAVGLADDHRKKKMVASVQTGGSTKLQPADDASRATTGASGESVSLHSVSHYSLASDGARLLRPADMEPHLEEHSIIFAEINDGAAADGDAPALDEPEEGMEEMTAEVIHMMKKWEAANPAPFDDDVSAVLPRLSRKPLDDGVGSAMYFDECRSSDTLALSRVFEQMEQPEASLAYCNLGSKGGMALAQCLQKNRVVRSLNIMSNGFQAAASQQIMRALQNNLLITQLDVSDNVLGSAAVITLAANLRMPKCPLVVLIMNRCGLGDDGATALAQGLEFNKHTATLSLQHNKIGDHGAAALGVLLSVNPNITHLDLSWNDVRARGADGLAQGLKENISLHTLLLRWNVLGSPGGVRLANLFYHNTALTTVDLSANRLGAEAALVIGEALKANDTLVSLDLSENPLGEDGIRHLMVMLVINRKLETLELKSCNVGKLPAERGAFNRMDAEGAFKLALSDPVERAIARQLCVNGLRQPKSWTKVKMNGRATPFDSSWATTLPEEGTLELVHERILGKREIMKELDEEDIVNLTKNMDSSWLGNSERLQLLRVIVGFSHLTAKQAPRFLRCFEKNSVELVLACVACFGSIVDSHNFIPVVLSTLPPHVDFMGAMLYFQIDNPTGHYELNLSSLVDRMVMRKLMDCAYYEGSSPNWKNFAFGKEREFSLTCAPAGWMTSLPLTGTVNVDFVSYIPPGSACPTLDASQLDTLILQINPLLNPDSADRSVPSVCKLRVASASIAITCEQCMTLINLFVEGDERAEVAVICFSRIVDRANFWQVLYTLKTVEQSNVATRLGYKSVFNAKHPSMHYRLETANPEHLAVMEQLCAMAGVNEYLKNLHNVCIDGKLVQERIVEDATVWSQFSANGTRLPVVELDFYGTDAVEQLLGVPCPSDVEAQNKALEMLGRRALLDRCVKIHAYWTERRLAAGRKVQSPSIVLLASTDRVVAASLVLTPNAWETHKPEPAYTVKSTGETRDFLMDMGELVGNGRRGWTGAPPKERNADLDEAALAELDRLEELARAEAEAAAAAAAGGKKGKKGKKGKGKDKKAPKKSEAQELAELLESRVFVPLEPVSAKVSSARIQSMSKPIPGGALEKQLDRLQAKRPNHWQIAWDRLMREGLDTYGEHIRYSPLYDYVWEVIDSDKRGMVTMNDFKAGLKVVLGVTPSEKTHRPRTPTEQSQENSRRLLELFKTIDTNLDGLMQWNEFEQAALAGWL